MSTPSSRLSPSRVTVSGTTEIDRLVTSSGSRSAVESVTTATRPAGGPEPRQPVTHADGQVLARGGEVGARRGGLVADRREALEGGRNRSREASRGGGLDRRGGEEDPGAPAAGGAALLDVAPD